MTKRVEIGATGTINLIRIIPDDTQSLIIKLVFSDNWTLEDYEKSLNLIDTVIKEHDKILLTTYLIIDFSSNPRQPPGSMQALILTNSFRNKNRCMLYGIATDPNFMVLIQQVFTRNVQVSEDHALMAIKGHPAYK